MADQRKPLPPPVHPWSKQQGASVSHNKDIIKPRVSVQCIYTSLHELSLKLYGV